MAEPGEEEKGKKSQRHNDDDCEGCYYHPAQVKSKFDSKSKKYKVKSERFDNFIIDDTASANSLVLKEKSSQQVQTSNAGKFKTVEPSEEELNDSQEEIRET